MFFVWSLYFFYHLIQSFWILFRCAGFQEWVESLPELLCAPTIPATAVEVLAKFACQNNPLFYKSLCQKLPDILSKSIVVFLCLKNYENLIVYVWSFLSLDYVSVTW